MLWRREEQPGNSSLHKGLGQYMNSSYLIATFIQLPLQSSLYSRISHMSEQ